MSALIEPLAVPVEPVTPALQGIDPGEPPLTPLGAVLNLP
jgi:hypothetical protein